MICHKCGYENKGGDKICGRCSAMLDYHEINADNIDISGLALADDKADQKVKKPPMGLMSKIMVLGIIVSLGIGGAIFIPKYLAEAKARIILEAITVARNGVEAYVKKHRVWPVTENDIQPGISADQDSKVGLVIKKGVIEITIPEEPGKVAKISPSIKSGRVVWRCENGGIGPEYLPIGCYK